MSAIRMENILSNENQNIHPKTCEYKGLTYFVLNDMNGRCFINVDGKKKYLDKNGCVCNKQKGTKSVKTAIETSTDKIIEHALVTAENAGYIGEGDVVIVSAGIATNSSPTSKRGLTNTMRVVTI